MEKQVFVSWSRPVSQRIAIAFCDAVESLPLGVKCWCSQRAADLPMGPYDHKRIIEAAAASDVCVSILTPENILSPWIFFEAGIFYGSEKKVYGLLACGLTHQEIKKRNNPIEGYHAYLSEEGSFLNLVKSINYSCNNIDESRFIKGAMVAHSDLLTIHSEECKKFTDQEMVRDGDLTGMIRKEFKGRP